tara:strand:- start:1649 stop:1846 length:198 start_codon:yes stop_codon:yes gene_type:complete
MELSQYYQESVMYKSEVDKLLMQISDLKLEHKNKIEGLMINKTRLRSNSPNKEIDDSFVDMNKII